ncbi:MAG: hypothetical protein ACRERD_35285 [Candidatus Binatia bacterium]
MAQLTTKEFADMIAMLAEHLRLDRLHERLLKANALVSRKRPPTAHVLATQLYQLSGGLQRAHPARYAVEVLWQEMLSAQVKEEHAKTIETLADRINACLTERMEIIPEKSLELVAALGAYHQALAALTNDEVASLEMVLRASADVARFFREHKEEIIAAEAKEKFKLQNEELAKSEE